MSSQIMSARQTGVPGADRAPDALTPQAVVERHKKALEKRSHWESHWQFSCWNEGDANRRRIEEVTPDDAAFRSCIRIARRAACGALDDPTGGATHYHAAKANPPWARGRAPIAVVGRHLFYDAIE